MTPTLFHEAVRSRRWTYEAFDVRYQRAAEELAVLEDDPRFAHLSVSSRTFVRWMAGELKTVPNPRACLVLEHLLGVPAEVLFGLSEASAASSDDELSGSLQRAELVAEAGPDPNLVPHWATLLRILAEAHNTIGSAHLHQAAVTEMALIRRSRAEAGGHLRATLLGVEARWAEFASWTAANLGTAADSAYWLDRALQLSQEAADGSMTAYILMRQAQTAIERRDAAAARRLAGRAVDMGHGGPRDRALSALRLAQALALAGNATGSEEALRDASRLVDEADDFGADDDPGTIGRHCQQAYVQAHRGHCLLLLGNFAQAARTLEDTLGSWPQELRQDEQLTRAWLALAYADSGRVAEAGTTGAELLALNASRGSVRVVRHLRQLDRSLASHSGPPAEVTTFRTAMAALAPRM